MYHARQGNPPTVVEVRVRCSHRGATTISLSFPVPGYCTLHLEWLKRCSAAFPAEPNELGWHSVWMTPLAVLASFLVCSLAFGIWVCSSPRALARLQRRFRPKGKSFSPPEDCEGMMAVEGEEMASLTAAIGAASVQIRETIEGGLVSAGIAGNQVRETLGAGLSSAGISSETGLLLPSNLNPWTRQQDESVDLL